MTNSLFLSKGEMNLIHKLTNLLITKIEKLYTHIYITKHKDTKHKYNINYFNYLRKGPHVRTECSKASKLESKR